MEYVIRLDQGDYYQQRGGYDWGRSGESGATTFGSKEDAEAEIRRCGLRSVNARVEEAW